MDWYFDAFRHYFDFSGRARRKAFWYFALFNVIASIVAAIIDASLGLHVSDVQFGVVGLVYGLLTIIPNLALGVRRLHDTDKSGWWLLIVLVPVVGIIVLLVFQATSGTPGSNRFGPDPKGGEVFGAPPVV